METLYNSNDTLIIFIRHLGARNILWCLNFEYNCFSKCIFGNVKTDISQNVAALPRMELRMGIKHHVLSSQIMNICQDCAMSIEDCWDYFNNNGSKRDCPDWWTIIAVTCCHLWVNNGCKQDSPHWMDHHCRNGLVHCCVKNGKCVNCLIHTEEDFYVLEKEIQCILYQLSYKNWVQCSWKFQSKDV